jgi:hypothetical protein
VSSWRSWVAGIAAALLLGGGDDDDGETGSASTLSDGEAVARGNELISRMESELIPAGTRYEELQSDPSDPEFEAALADLEAVLGDLFSDFQVAQPEDAELDELWDRTAVELGFMQDDVRQLQEALGTSDVDTHINTVNRDFTELGDAVTNLEEALAAAS